MTTDHTTQPLDLEAIRARAAHVIAGPWTVGEPRCVDEVDAWEIPIHLPSVVDGKPDERGEFAVVRYRTGGFHYPHGEAIADAEFIAAAREDIPALLAEVERLRGLVGDENQPGWEGCSRAEAIRQAESFHASVMEWKRAHDERRAERDEARAEVERMRPIVLAAIAWRETEALPVHALDDQELALIAAVDDMGEVAW